MNNWLEESNPRTLRLMLAAIALLLFTAIIVYLIAPEYKQFRKVNESFTALQRLNLSHTNIEQQLHRVKNEVALLDKKLHGNMAHVPVEQIESYIIGQLQKISWNTGVELLSVTPSKGKKVQIFQENLFKVKLNAGYFEFFQWIQNINQELGYIVIKQLTIQPDAAVLINPKLSITLTLVLFSTVTDS